MRTQGYEALSFVPPNCETICDCTDCGFHCGNKICDCSETSSTCCGDCKECGDGNCDCGETFETCPLDCTPDAGCGDGTCDPDETCEDFPQDCGPCPDGTFFRAGECVEFIENSCLNSVCDEGEGESCPWDCPYLFEKEEKEEILSEEEQKIVDERIRKNREEFFRESGMSEEEIEEAMAEIYSQNETQEETLPEEVEE